MIRSLLMAGGIKCEIEFVGRLTVNANGTNSIDISSLDIQANDLILATVVNASHTTTDYYASGYIEVFPIIQASSSDRNVSITTRYKVADGTETSVILNSAMNYGMVHVRVYRNVDIASPIDSYVTARSNEYGGGASINPLPITPNSKRCMIVAVGGIYNGSDVTYAYFTSNDLNNFSTRAHQNLYGTVFGGGDFMLSAGLFDPQAFNYYGAQSNVCWGAGTIALKCNK